MLENIPWNFKKSKRNLIKFGNVIKSNNRLHFPQEKQVENEVCEVLSERISGSITVRRKDGTIWKVDKNNFYYIER